MMALHGLSIFWLSILSVGAAAAFFAPPVPSLAPAWGAVSSWQLVLRAAPCRASAPDTRDFRRVCRLRPAPGGPRAAHAAGGAAQSAPEMPRKEAEHILGAFDQEQQRAAREGFEGQREGFGGGTSAAKFAEACRPDWPQLQRAVLSLASDSEKVRPYQPAR